MKKKIKLLNLVVLSIYASDLHKLTINTTAVLIKEPLKYVELANTADIYLAALCLVIVLYSMVTNKRILNKIVTIPMWSQIVLVGLFSISLITNGTSLSLHKYYQFIGGNLVLFLGALFLFEDIDDIKIFFRVWLLSSLIISIISIYLYSIGATYHSARAAVIPGLDFRAGYVSAISIIYLIINKESFKDRLSAPKNNLIYISFLITLLFSVITSGSKASFGLLFMILIVYFLLYLNNDLDKYIYIFLGLSIVAIILYFIAKADAGKYGTNILEVDQYITSLTSRVDILKRYWKNGLSSLFTGLGISASYGSGEFQRTHSMITAFFVQIGLFGVFSYLVFIGSVIITGLNTVIQKYLLDDDRQLSIALLVIFVFSLFFSEIASDIPGNRFMWMFAGLIVSMRDFLKELQLNHTD